MKPKRKITPFHVMALVREAQRYEDTVHFEVGQPDLPPPPGVRRALAEVAEAGFFGYTESRGLMELRRKIADHYRHEYGVEVSPERILVTPGSSVAFMVAYTLVLGVGERLGVADPSYPCYKNFATMVGAETVAIPAGVEASFQIRPEMLEGRRLSALHVASPNNPTGILYDPDNLKALTEYCEAEGIALLSDELYHGLVYDTKPRTALEFGENVLVANGFSKAFCMPGLRLGWLVVPEALAEAAENVVQNLYLSAPTLSQYAALEAFDHDYLAKVRTTFRTRRDWLYGELKELFDIPAKPEGAFYLWCDASRYTDDAFEFSRRLLHERHVAVTPGLDFGEYGTKRALRFAYTRGIEEMKRGVERLRDFIKA